MSRQTVTPLQAARRRFTRRGIFPRRARSLCLLAGFALTACADRPVPRPTPLAAAENTAIGGITAADVAARVGLLAHDSLGGRATPSPGLDGAARYIAAEFERMGLRAAPDQPALIQRYTVETMGGATQAPNVVAVLPGSDPALRDTYVVYSAHMDHVGIGPPDASGDSIYNGADDDASGTAALLEIAEAFAALPTAPARSIAFVAVSGEELGLLGSRAFLAQGGIAPSRMVADINIDMVGRNAPDSLVVIGLGYSDLGERLRAVMAGHEELGLSLSDDPWPEEQFFLRSDHFNFAAAGIPALFLFAGVHEDYHRPSDHADRVDAGKVARIATAAFLLGLQVATDPGPPEWTAEGRAAVRPGSR